MMNLKEMSKRLKRDIPAVYLSLKSKETPVAAKLVGGIALIYALSPIDLIPDFIPILGYLDDMIILPLLIGLTIRCIPRETFQRFRMEAEEMWENGQPKKWFYAIPVAALWLLIIRQILRVL